MKLLTLDAETFYDSEYTLKKLSTTEYVFDPRFELIGMGVTLDGRKVWMEEPQWRAFAKALDWSQVAVLAHHAHFDGLILSYHYGVRPCQWFDTLSMARAIHGETKAADLDSLMRYYEVGEKGHEVVAAKGKRRVDFTQTEWNQYGVYCLNDCTGTRDVFRKMLPGFPRRELDLIDITVRMYTEPSLLLDMPKMEEYLAWEIARKEDLLRRIGATRADLSSSDKFAELLRSIGVEPPTKDSPKTKNSDGSPKQIWAFAKTDPTFQELLADENDNVRWLCEARQGAKSVGNETRSGRLIGIGAGGRALPVYLKYAGAGTFRWSGADKVNWQNFERLNKKDPRKGTIRRSICAPAGHFIVGGDAAQIEARFNAWYSGQTDLVDAFATGKDAYSLFASVIYNRHIDRKKNPDDEIPGHVGKTSVLGLGFQMGYKKFGGEMLKGAGGAAPVQFTAADIEKLGIDPRTFLDNPHNVAEVAALPSRLSLKDKVLHYIVAHHIVGVYRRTNDKIVANWGTNKEIINLMAQGYTGPVGNGDIFSLVKDGILLPSGLVMHYRDLRLEDKQYTYLAKRGKRSKLYGGLLTENLTQALCRIIVSDAMWRLHKDGLKIVHMEHDFIGGVCPIPEAVYWKERLLEEIATPPDWAPGIPLAAEGGYGLTLADTK